jgi:MYND finger
LAAHGHGFGGGVELYNSLCEVCTYAFKLDGDNASAKTLIYKLGDCHHLFRTVLELVPTVGAMEASDKKQRLLTHLFAFIGHYLMSPSRLPSDRETCELVKLCISNGASAFTTPEVNDSGETMLHLLRSWSRLQALSANERWQQHLTGCIRHGDISEWKQAHKTRRQAVRDESKLSESVCANCLVSGNQVDVMLLACSQCRKVKYCSKECQREHWKKAHKIVCQK